MKFKANLDCLRAEEKISQKGEPYTLGLFIQGVEALQLIIPEGSEVGPGFSGEVELKYSPNYKTLSILNPSYGQA